MVGDIKAENIIDYMVSAIVMLDSRLRIVTANPAFEEMVDLSIRRMKDMPIKHIFVETTISPRALAYALKRSTSFTQRDISITLPDGKELLVDLDVTIISKPPYEGNLVVEIRQVEHHHRVRQEDQMLAQHHAARDLIRALAHEIKNPLGGVRGAAQLLERSLPSEELKEFTGIIIDEVDRLTKVVDRMLGPKSKPNMLRTNIHEVAERVRQLVSIELPENIHFKIDYDPSIPDLLADKELLIQAALNIARNASQILQEQGGKGRITLRTRAQRQVYIDQKHYRLAVRMDIEDNGPGIEQERLKTIFYPMVTGRSGGTGLGLSIAQALVNQHLGIIDVISRPGKTVFSIFLPIIDKKHSGIKACNKI
ncbi:MAG: nitrogen regulation protein NR(II) [Kangiellaceae bacterium]|jgi:two-component system nitrogen regulation sensor histidine kinase GlnL|nr:nitrogen regulation protein NR(II) [Kangiellaceae bacterium]|tara:strand:+ start:3279 stop:4379 length:1101 start_codon:yes stop_codon:yes gene_type:complete